MSAITERNPVAFRRLMRMVAVRSVPWLLLAVSLWMITDQVRRPAMLPHVFAPWAEIGILAIAMTPIILTGGIDLSVGSIVALSGMVLGILWRDANWPIWWACSAAILTGLLAGGLNGAFVVWGLSPLVTTLATMAFYRGLAMSVSGTDQVDGFPAEFIDAGSMAGWPVQFVVFGICAALYWVVIHRMRAGQFCYAIGENRAAARVAAVPVVRVEWMLYAASGLLAAIVAVLNAMKQDVVVPDAQTGVELQAIAAVVVGGTLITGGRGGILRTLLGIAVIASLDVGLKFVSIRIKWLTAESRLIVIGVLLVAIAIWNERGLKPPGNSNR